MTKQTVRSSRHGPKLESGGQGARRNAALILEVLAGQLHPSEAAQVLGVGLPRYYQLEKRGLEGLIAACEPVARGPGPEKKIESLQKRIRQLERDVARYQALARTSQKVLGVPPVKPVKGGRKRRTPATRALKIARGIRHETPNCEPMNINSQDADAQGG